MDIDYTTTAYALIATFFLAILWYTVISPIRKGRAKVDAVVEAAARMTPEEWEAMRKPIIETYLRALRRVDLDIRLYDKKEQVARRSVPRLRRLGKI